MTEAMKSLTEELSEVLDSQERYKLNQKIANSIVQQLDGLSYFNAISTLEIVRDIIKHKARI